ncbi:hypothetical protein [Duganella sp. BuS-21]|uniref:hypothetical protein n=1 Tax=Duganella sp. BuS-21 TaxID=2943848 RepID=UPI0035A593D9
MPTCRRSQHGAALLLLILLMGFGAAALLMGGFQPEQVEARRQRETLATLAQAREALLGYALNNGRLPRPAVSATNGVESTQPCSAAAACTGFIPWVTLGLPGLDGWGKRLHYSVTAAFTEAPLRQDVTVADKRVVSRRPNGVTYFLAGYNQCNKEYQCAPAVIFSSGRHNPGVAASGMVQISDSNSNIDEIYNDSAVNDFIVRPASLPGDERALGGEFDDLVIWLPLASLYQRMGVTGTLN